MKKVPQIQPQAIQTEWEVSGTNPKPEPVVWIMLADHFLMDHYRSKLKSEDYIFQFLHNPLQWETRLTEQTPAILVIDLSLYPSDPIGILHRIKALSATTEIIVLSNTDDVHIAIASFKAGITDYYLKPTPPETLLWAIQKTVRQTPPLKPI